MLHAADVFVAVPYMRCPWLEPGPSPINSVLAATTEILSLLKDQVVTVLNPAPGPVVLYTGIVSVRSTDLVWCSLANIGDTAIPTVKRRVVVHNGTVLSTAETFNVQPGHSGLSGSGGVSAFVRCEFEFEGLARSVRATMFIEAQDRSTVAVLDAR